MNGTRMLVGVLCIGLLASASSISLATTSITTPQETSESEIGDWPDSCENATVLEAGTYEGTLSPADGDALIVEGIGEGNYVAINFSFSGGADEIELTEGGGEDFAETTFTAGTGESVEDAYGQTNLYDDGNILELSEQDEEELSVYSLRVYAEDDNPICIRFNTDGTTAASWRLSIAPENPQAPPVICPDNLTIEAEDNES